MKPPCEIVVWYVLPSIRCKLAKELLSLGMKQKEISEVLDITQPAVSQYISDKRGQEITFDDKVTEVPSSTITVNNLKTVINLKQTDKTCNSDGSTSEPV